MQVECTNFSFFLRSIMYRICMPQFLETNNCSTWKYIERCQHWYRVSHSLPNPSRLAGGPLLRVATIMRTTDTHYRHTLQTLNTDTHYRHALQTRTKDTHYRHALQTHTTDTLQTHSFSFLTRRTYFCSSFVAISSLVLELLKKCRVR